MPAIQREQPTGRGEGTEALGEDEKMKPQSRESKVGGGAACQLRGSWGSQAEPGCLQLFPAKFLSSQLPFHLT